MLLTFLLPAHPLRRPHASLYTIHGHVKSSEMRGTLFAQLAGGDQIKRICEFKAVLPTKKAVQSKTGRPVSPQNPELLSLCAEGNPS
ncbi:hypothetical protein LP421_09895 [Rhizobium sp. RCAM05350]|nr:hypothetical protein LP421_09895 [Rhizobium sp. RCAM05350]